MRARSLLLAVSLACARGISGPAPRVTKVVAEQDQSGNPATVCNAQGDPAAGWLLDVLGDGFAPMPANTLSASPTVAMPRATFTGPETYTLPQADVRFSDKTRMTLAMRTSDSAADPHALAPGTYALTVSNLNGASSTLPNAVQVVPPPSLVAVAPSRICGDRPQRLTIAGSGFRSTDRVSFVPQTGAPVVVPPLAIASGEIDVLLASGALAPGDYTVQVVDPDGCAAPFATSGRGFGVTDVTVFTGCATVGSLNAFPRFGSQQKNQPITIHNVLSGPQRPFSGPAPSVTITAPIKGGSTAVPIPLLRVAFVDGNTITAVVPTCSGLSPTDASGTCANGIASGGPYTIDVGDPSGAFGSTSGPQGFVVVAEPPAIASISPATIDTSGTLDLAIASGGVSGANFAATSKPQIVFPVGANTRACDLPVNSLSASVIHAQIQPVGPASCVEYDPTGKQLGAAGGFALNVGFYVIRVQDTADPAFGDFSGLTITQPAAAPSDSQAAGASLAMARADFPLVQAGDDAGNHYLYALGGIDGPMGQAGTNALTSVEMSPIDAFGALVAFQVLDRGALGSARHGSAAVSVQVPGDTGYVFVLGGIGASGAAIATVERAQVLKSADAPAAAAALMPGGMLASGTFYYRVAAVVGATESLASDEQPVTGSGANKAVLTWPCVANAVKYRVYRTSTANAASGTEQLLSEPTGCTFTDDGSIAPSGLQPQPPGALGAWVAMPSLAVARGQFAAHIVAGRVYLVGGCTGSSCNGDGGEVPAATGYETSQISVNALGLFTAGPIGHARKQNALSVASNATAPDRVAAGEAWLVIGGGIAGNPHTVLLTTSGAIEVAHAVVSGVSQTALTFSDATYNQGGTSIPFTDPSFSFGRYGGWSEVAGDRLFGFGASAIAGNPIAFRSGDVCNGAPCTGAASFTGNLPLTGTAFTSRFLSGSTLFGGFVYSAGGLNSTATNAAVMPSVDRIPW